MATIAKTLAKVSGDSQSPSSILAYFSINETAGGSSKERVSCMLEPLATPSGSAEYQQVNFIVMPLVGRFTPGLVKFSFKPVINPDTAFVLVNQTGPRTYNAIKSNTGKVLIYQKQ